jgi:1-acyl-sn-glycerol-3-phosphate acyltransferase
VAIPFIGRFVPYLGGLPLPSDLGATRNFMKATDYLVKKNKAIVIYPEAHLWPYYTKIRPFLATSFHYPVKYHTPTYCFTNTYHQRKNNKKVKIITYIDGPFYPQAGLDDIQAREDLRQKVYQAMTSRALTSDKELIHYVRREDHD